MQWESKQAYERGRNEAITEFSRFIRKLAETWEQEAAPSPADAGAEGREMLREAARELRQSYETQAWWIERRCSPDRAPAWIQALLDHWLQQYVEDALAPASARTLAVELRRQLLDAAKEHYGFS
jgi:hypothetical protein